VSRFFSIKSIFGFGERLWFGVMGACIGLMFGYLLIIINGHLLLWFKDYANMPLPFAETLFEALTIRVCTVLGFLVMAFAPTATERQNRRLKEERSSSQSSTEWSNENSDFDHENDFMKIDHINIVVADLERSAAFYEAVFGMKRGFSALLEGLWIDTVTGLSSVKASCLFLETDGGARLELLRYDSPQGQNSERLSCPNTIGVRHIAFEVADLNGTLQKLRALGREPISEPVEVPFRVGNLGHKKLCYFHDPDGVLLEIAAYETQ
jgi:catechol 2,3-dioxygenase-like lactoylglutathione lyase family enzyme